MNKASHFGSVINQYIQFCIFGENDVGTIFTAKIKSNVFGSTVLLRYTTAESSYRVERQLILENSSTPFKGCLDKGNKMSCFGGK